MEGCFNVKVADLERDNHLRIECGAVNPISPIVERIGNGIKVVSGLVDGLMRATSSDLGEHLKLRCSLVCSVSDLFYMNVTPAEVQWITDDMGVYFDVESNVEWIVLTT